VSQKKAIALFLIIWSKILVDRMPFFHRSLRLLGFLLVAGLLAGFLAACGPRQPEASEPAPTRTPRPTFTPTPLPAQVEPAPPAQEEPPALPEQAAPEPADPPEQNQVQPEPQAPAAEPTPMPEQPTPTPVDEARAVVNSPSVNVRRGPGTNHPVAGVVERGTELRIVGKNQASDWWKVCCVNQQEVWIAAFLVDTLGPVEAVAVAADIPASPPTSTPAPVPPTATPAPAEAPSPATAFAFDLVAQDQFPEDNIVRVFVYVYSDSEPALAGYSVKVKHNGGELPVNGQTAGGNPSLTWPFHDDRQRFTNLKVEFSIQPPGGPWEVQLVDGGGNPVGPAVTFNLTNDETDRELYVRYKKR
jgi:hypothetical protein